MDPYQHFFAAPFVAFPRHFIRSLVLIVVLAGQVHAAQVTLSNLTQTYSGAQKVVTVTTVPAGLQTTVTYAGSTTAPTEAGSYAVVATIVDPVETGSGTGTLKIDKAGQTITMSTLSSKTYGDAPFSITATASSGLPVTKWESSDPSVAAVSSSGSITVIGAGQTSIIASNTGNSNFNAAWIAKPLNVARSAAPLPSGTQTVIYNTNAQGLDPAVLPSGQATEITYRDTAVPEAAATPQVVFQNGPDTLALSYLSTGLQAVGYWGLAKYVSLAGSARKLESCDVTLVSWAGYLGGKNNNPAYRFKEWADLQPPGSVVPPSGEISVPGNSGGYFHPVTLSFYDFINESGEEVYRLLTSKTVNAFIPWRPVKGADGVTDYPNDGYAFRVPFSFTDGVILPQQVWVAVSFNTEAEGVAPVGRTTGPGGTTYAPPSNALNVSRPATAPVGQLVGSTLLTSTLLFADWRWQSAIANTGPMLRLRCVPTNATLAAPVNAGTYEVKTWAAGFEENPTSTSLLTIEKAPLEVSLTNLIQVRDGLPKPVGVTTHPVGVSTIVTYSGGNTAPSGLGSYPVVAVSANPNYLGQTSTVLTIGDTFSSWQNATFEGSGLPPEKTTDTADADADGLSNFLEYALNLNPISPEDSSWKSFKCGDATVAFVYRRNLHALDVDYTLQQTSSLSSPSSWDSIAPLSETTLSDDGSTRIIKATVAKPSGQPRHFLRLKTTR